MRLAFYTYSYTDRLNLSIPDCFERIARTGYAGVDESSTFGPAENSDSVTPERRRAIRDAARKHKLRVEAIVTHAELTQSLAGPKPLDLAASIDLASELGGDVVTFHLGGPVKEIPDAELWKRVVDAVEQASRHGDAKHVALAIDVGPWPTWIVRTSDDLARLFDDVGSKSFGVNFDPSYLAVMGIDPVGFVERFGSRIRHVHLKDHVGKYPKWEHHIPGQGELDYAPIVAALGKARFKGALAIECFVTMKFEEACEVGYRTLAAAFAKGNLPLTR
jgi:sugar phosphate isomerase/epimerase